jgi:cleavage and polyadenylation specificity factor subunit 1
MHDELLVLTILIELGMEQIISMEDEETGDELNIINASFADPYLLIQREDSSVKIYKATGEGEVEDVEASGLSSTKWLSASLFQSSSFTEVFAFLLTPEGGLRVFAMSQLEKPSYVAEALGFLPPLLTMDYAPRRSAAKATITEILAADLGDATSKSPHLIVRLLTSSACFVDTNCARFERPPTTSLSTRRSTHPLVPPQISGRRTCVG